MSWRKKILSPWLRTLAALALLVFIAAQALCFMHCNLGSGHGDNEAEPSCHRHGKATHDDHGTPAPSPTTTCSTLKTMEAGADAPAIIAPHFHTLYLLAPLSVALNATDIQAKSAFSRQGRTREMVSTPVVCLFPAFRSLAPPLPS